MSIVLLRRHPPPSESLSDFAVSWVECGFAERRYCPHPHLAALAIMMILVVVIVGVCLRHRLLHEVVVPIEIHADTPLGPPQEGGSEKFLLSHRFSVWA